MNKPSRLVRRSGVVFAAAALAGCSFFAQPALPRRARIDTADSGIPVDELRQIVDRADILYLPAERVEADEQSGAALRLLDLVEQSAPRAAVGWGTVAGELRPLFQEWNGGKIALDAFIDRIRFVSDSQRDAVRRLLRESRERGLTSVPVSCPTGQSCTADNIAREFGALGGGKLLVVIDRRELDGATGVPFFVAQRLQVRQVVFDARPAGREHPRLVAGAAEIVNATPRAGGDRR